MGLAAAWAVALSATVTAWLALGLICSGPSSVPRDLALFGALSAWGILVAAGWAWAVHRRFAGLEEDASALVLEPVLLLWAALLVGGGKLFLLMPYRPYSVLALVAAWTTGGWMAFGAGRPTDPGRSARVVAASTLLLMLTATLFLGGSPGPPMAAMAAGLLLAPQLQQGLTPARSRWDRWDGLAWLLLMGLMVPARLAYDPGHMSYFLGPVNGLRHGGHSLVDVFCQYGPGPILFLRGCFDATGITPMWPAFSALNLMGFVAWMSMEAWLLRRTLASPMLAWVGVGFMLVCCYYGAVDGPGAPPGGVRVQNLDFPSVGLLRFGLPLLSLVLLRLRLDGPANGRRWDWALLGVVALSAVWSVETFVYTLAGVAGYFLWDRGFGGLGRVLGALAFSAGAIGILSLAIRWGAGDWPQWGLYLGQARAYGGGFAAIPIYVWSPWVFAPALALGGLLYLVVQRCSGVEAQDPADGLVVAVSLQALAQFTYYIMRAHPFNLAHIIAPFIFLAVFWTDRLATSPGGGGARHVLLAALIAGLFSLAWAYGAQIPYGLDDTAAAAIFRDETPTEPGLARWGEVVHPGPSSAEVQGALGLLRLWAPHQARVALFLPGPAHVEAHLLSGTTEPFAVNCYAQDDEASARHAVILRAPSGLQDGDVILAEHDAAGGWDAAPAKAPALMAELWAAARSRFRWVALGQMGGVKAFRLERLRARGPV